MNQESVQVKAAVYQGKLHLDSKLFGRGNRYLEKEFEVMGFGF